MPAYDARVNWMDWALSPACFMHPAPAGERPTVLHFEHWFLCVTFLVAAIATKWRWKRKADNHKRADA